MLTASILAFSVSFLSQTMTVDANTTLPMIGDVAGGIDAFSISYSVYSGMPEFQGIDKPALTTVFAHALSSNGNATIALLTKSMAGDPNFVVQKSSSSTLGGADIAQLTALTTSASLPDLPLFFNHPSLDSDGAIAVLSITTPTSQKVFHGSDIAMRSSEPLATIIAMAQRAVKGVSK